MIRWLPAALLLACGPLNPLAWADSPPALRIGVLEFHASAGAGDGAAARDLFSTSLYRNFPGLSVVEPSELEAVIAREHLRSGDESVAPETAEALRRILAVDALISGSIMALDKDAGGGGGTLMMSARLVKPSTGQILWADTRTVRVGAPLLGRLWGGTRDSDAVLTGKLLELGVFQLVQDLGKRLPESALSPPGGRRAAERGSRDDAHCSPPAFYGTLARDSDWFYGVGKGPDADQARDAALANLAKQVTGHVVETPSVAAGAGQREASKGLDDLPTETGLLAGWEQDDFRRCDGVSYVMVRIGKERIRKFLASNSGSTTIGDRKPSALEQRLDRVDSSSDRLLDQSAGTPARALAPLLIKETVASVKTLIGSGRALDQVSRANVASTEMMFSDLLDPKERCGTSKCAGGLTLEQAGVIAEARRKITAGTISMDDVVRVHAIFSHYSKGDDDRDFLTAVISRKMPPAPLAANFVRTRELAFPLAWSSALSRNDWVHFFKYCADYLRFYPQGIYAAAAEKNRENAANILMMRNMELAAGPDSGGEE
jgi:hypothetical protein